MKSARVGIKQAAAGTADTRGISNNQLVSPMLSEFVCDANAPFLCPAPSVCAVGPLGYYNGSLAVTEAGAECLNWAEFPDYVLQYPDRGLGDHNYCRNPDGGTTPWCFYRLVSGAVGWANCDCNQGKGCAASGLKPQMCAAQTCKWQVEHPVKGALNKDCSKLLK